MIIRVIKLPSGPHFRSTYYGFQRLNQPIRNYANHPHPKKEVNTGAAYTIGALTAVLVGTVGYAKYNNDFRVWMGENVPYTDGFFKFIFQEKQSWEDYVKDIGNSIKQAIVGSEKKKQLEKLSKASDKDYTPPHPAFANLLDKTKVEEKFSEIRVQDKNKIDIGPVKDVEKPKERPKLVSNEDSPQSIVDLEASIGDTATHAVKAYGKAANAFKEYCAAVESIIDDSIDRLGSQSWNTLKEKTKKKDEILKDAENTARQTAKDLEKFRCLIDENSFKASDTAKATARRNIDRVRHDIRLAQEEYEKEKRLCDITEKYWRKVFDARCHFIEELEIIFPEFDINKKRMALKASDLDLFVVHAFKHVLHYQKELQKLETVTQMKLRQAVEAAKRGDPEFEIKEVMIREEIDAEKRKLADEFARKCLQQRKESERELRHRLKCQEQAHIDHLADVIAVKEAEMDRDFQRKVDERVSEEQAKFKTQMAGMVARMTGMRNAISERMEADQMARQSQVLWSACQALYRAVKNAVPGIPYQEQVRPLQCEIDAIKKAAADNDELVSTVLNAIPSEARSRGVFPEGALRERFLKVERAAKKVALVPEEGGKLPLYFLSYLQAALLSSAANPIPQDELDDKPTDFSALNTYDILQRARYWVDRGNYAQTLKYMNLLKGASRCIAMEWMNEARILLETQQAAETLMAHAVASGLLHI